MKKLMNLRGATALKVAQIAFCQSDNECPTGQLCCFGNCGIE